MERDWLSRSLGALRNDLAFQRLRKGTAVRLTGQLPFTSWSRVLHRRAMGQLGREAAQR